MHDQGHVTVPHVPGVVILHRSLKDGAEIAGVSDHGMGKRHQHGVTHVDAAGEAVIVSVIGATSIDGDTVCKVGQNPQVLTLCNGREGSVD